MAISSGDMLDFASFFCDATGFKCPYGWQRRVAVEGLPEVLPIPTGLGKTEGAVLAWAWRRLNAEAQEPLHLVYCLPMRSLVRQTVQRLTCCFGALAKKRNIPKVPVYSLMGGAADDEWAGKPDEPWVLVGTQDQLLSRALNRGYSMSRFEWPVHFGLLNQDCRWIVDEVQLMGPGLWTTAQLDWLRRKRFPAVKPCLTTWMSATVGQGFLATTDRSKDGIGKADFFHPKLDEDENQELRRRFLERCAPVDWFKPSGGKRAAGLREQIASRAIEAHKAGTLSLIICNTVKGAQDLFKALPDVAPKILLTSRFRPTDRRTYEQMLLGFEARRSNAGTAELAGDPGLICVSTQVIEAGVDVSAHRLWCELAPWPSIIQRLGRLNRDGRDNSARACLWQTPQDSKQRRDEWVGPYRKSDLDSAKTLIDALSPLSQERPFTAALRDLQETRGELLNRVLEPELEPLPRALDVHGLFSTERDLHGGFTDVSAFVRNADPDADLTVFWRVWQGTRPPRGEALDGPPFEPESEGCPVAFYHVREVLKKQRSRAWIWNDEDERWQACAPGDLRPGMAVLLHRDAGGYSPQIGWTGEPRDDVRDAPAAGPGRALWDDERTESGAYVSVDVHLRDARGEAERICDALGLSGDFRAAVVNAAAFHDIGKVHPKWQSALPSGSATRGGPWAKCPRVIGLDVPSEDPIYSKTVTRLRPMAVKLPDKPRREGRVRLCWIVDRKLTREELDELSKMPKVRWAGHVPFRPGVRHEAASALAMWKRYREGGAGYPALAVYLAATHHGKVRTVLRSIKGNGDVFGVSGQPDRLLVNTESWPLDFSVAADGAAGEWSDGGFMLTDYGWTGLVADLLGPWRSHEEDRSNVGAVPENEPRRLGPFVLAWLEALVRVADWRASAKPSRSCSIREVSGE